MKKLLFPLTILLMALLCLTFRKDPGNSKQTVNPVIGDISFVSKFGHQPDANTDEILRIKTHLEYVEIFLRNKDVSNLSPEQMQNRKHLLDLLYEYRTAGIFPRNYDYADQRKPCFIDKEGRICAVGYLVKQTAGREAAEQINNKFKYEELLAMNDESLDSWISGSGLTKEECAMIQPTYGGPNGESNYISTGYAVSSSALSGANISFGIINSIQISKSTKTKTIPIVGLLTGATQVMVGAFGMPSRVTYDEDYTNKSKRSLAAVNIGLGTSTMILSMWNLLKNKKPKESKTCWNIYSFPARNNNTGIALSFTKRF